MVAKRFTEEVQIRQQSLSTGAAQGILSLSQRLEGFKQQSLALQKSLGEKKGRAEAAETAQRRDEEGRLVAPEKRGQTLGDIILTGGARTRAFNKTLHDGYLASLENDSRKELAGLELENRDNIGRYNDQIEGYKAGVLKGVDPASRQDVEIFLDKSITNSRIRIQERTMAKAEAASKADIRQAIESAGNESASFAREGEMQSSADALQSAFINIDRMVEGGLASDKGAKMKRDLEREATEQGFRFQLDTVSDVEGIDAGFDRLEEMSNKVPKGWTPDEWDGFIKSAQKDLNRKDARINRNNKELLKARKKEVSVQRGRIFNNPGIPADPAKGSQDRKDVNAAYEQDSNQWLNLSVQEQINNNVDFIKNTGIVPDRVISGINAAMRSGSAGQVEIMGDIVARLEELPSAANVIRDIPDESRSLSRQIADMRRSGIETEQAVEIARKTTFGMTEQQKEAIRINTQEVSKDLPSFLEDMVDDKFDPSSIPFFGEEPDIPTDMQADFNVAFKNFMVLTGGSSDQSKSLAFNSLRKTWSVTDIAGDNRFMKFAPEAFYSVDGFDDQWMDEQFLEEMELEGIDGAVIGVDFNTGRSQTPSYPVMITNDSGFLDIATDGDGNPLRWKPDFTVTDEYKDAVAGPGKRVQKASKRRKDKLVKRADWLRRKITHSTLFGIPRAEREEFLSSDEGKAKIKRNIRSLLLRDKIDEVEFNQLMGAFNAVSE